MMQHEGAYARAFCALRRLSKRTRSKTWKFILRDGWTARTPPPKWRIESDYDMAVRAARRWQDIIENSVLYDKNRKYTSRCNSHVRMYRQYAAVLLQLLSSIDPVNWS